MPTLDKTELNEAVGKEVLKGAKIAGKEMAKTKTDSESREKELLDFLEVVTDSNVAITLRIYKKPTMSATPKFVGNYFVDKEALSSYGLDAVVQQYCGGGTYSVKLTIPGSEKVIERTVEIEGESLIKNSTFYDRGAAGAGVGWENQPPMGFPMNRQYPGNNGPGNGFGQFGPQNAQQQQMMQQMMWNQQNQPEKEKEDPMTKALLLMLASEKSKGEEPKDDTELKLLRDELVATKRERELDKLEASRKEDAVKFDQKFEALQQTLNKLIEKQNEPKTNPQAEMLKAFVPVASAVLPALLTKGDNKDLALQNMFGTMMTNQQAGSAQNIEMLKTMMDSKGDPADRFAKMMAASGDSMATMVGLVGTILQSTVKESGASHPAIEIFDKVLEQGSLIAQSMVQGGFSGEQDDDEDVVETQVLEPPTVDPHLIAERQREQWNADQAQQEAQQQELSIESFDVAMQKIISRICDGDDAHEIAFALWKHAVSGVEIAYSWFLEPRDATLGILSTLVAQGSIQVDKERMAEIANAIIDFNELLMNQGTPEEFIAKYELKAKMPKAIRRPIEYAPVEGDIVDDSEVPVDTKPANVVEDAQFDDVDATKVSDETSTE